MPPIACSTAGRSAIPGARPSPPPVSELGQLGRNPGLGLSSSVGQGKGFSSWGCLLPGSRCWQTGVRYCLRSLWTSKLQPSLSPQDCGTGPPGAPEVHSWPPPSYRAQGASCLWNRGLEASFSSMRLSYVTPDPGGRSSRLWARRTITCRRSLKTWAVALCDMTCPDLQGGRCGLHGPHSGLMGPVTGIVGAGAILTAGLAS